MKGFELVCQKVAAVHLIPAAHQEIALKRKSAMLKDVPHVSYNTLHIKAHFIMFVIYLAWKNWSKWTECTLTCGTGTQERDRTCVNNVTLVMISTTECQKSNNQIDMESAEERACHIEACPISKDILKQ